MTANKESKIGVRAAIAIAMLAAAFGLPAQAVAGSCSESGSDPTAAQYCSHEVVIHENRESNVSESNNSVSNNSVSESSNEVIESGGVSKASGSLPFTGLDVTALIAAAAVLTGTGLALRRISRNGIRKV